MAGQELAADKKDNNSFALFTDVSLNPQKRIGIGCYLLVPLPFLNAAPAAIQHSEITTQLHFKKFADTSSTKLEIQTVLWALEDYRVSLLNARPELLHLYTDSQCVAELLGRRVNLEKKNFVAGRSGQVLANAGLYRTFFALHDDLAFEVTKVTGHASSASHSTVERIFSCVDKEVRRALKTDSNTEDSTMVKIIGFE